MSMFKSGEMVGLHDASLKWPVLVRYQRKRHGKAAVVVVSDRMNRKIPIGTEMRVRASALLDLTQVAMPTRFPWKV